MEIIAVANQKGGVGKSSTAMELGAALILRGQRVLYIDLDGQGNLSYSMKANTAGYNALGVLQRPETAAAEIQHTENGDIIASSPAMANADTLITETGKEYRLKEALEPLKDKYDYVIIDTPPALGIATVNALTAATGVLIPSQADIYSLQGVGQLAATIEAIRKYCNPGLKILGIVLTRFNSRTAISREVAQLLEQTARQLNTRLCAARVRECTALKEAQAYRTSVTKYAPRSNAAADYKALLAEILGTE